MTQVDIRHLTPTLISQQFDAKYLYDQEFEVETQLANSRWHCRYTRTRTKKRKL